jgi:hypothetical protein
MLNILNLTLFKIHVLTMSAGRYTPLGDSIEDSLESYRVQLSPGSQKHENDSPDANS